MKILIAGVSLSIALAYAATGALATDGNIALKGRVLQAACTVASSSKDMTVKLGNVSSIALSGNSGKTSVPVRFKISVYNCEPGWVSVVFDGTSANNDNTVIKLTQEVGVATGVGVQLHTSPGSIVPLFTQVNKYLIYPEDRGFDFLFDANYVSIADTVTAGPANATSNFTLSYN